MEGERKDLHVRHYVGVFPISYSSNCPRRLWPCYLFDQGLLMTRLGFTLRRAFHFRICSAKTQ